jgi:TfoX/Sxy family transcriptional regulator of competence genes
MAKKKMLRFSAERSAALESKLKAYGYVAEKKKMFGHETFFTNGYMFTGANVDGIFVHVGQEARDRALKEKSGVAPFKPMEGMVMREYLLLEEPVCSDESRLKAWLDTSYAYLNGLPPKARKKK